ncbi:type II secretion system F family protein [Halorubrum sp. DTA98]|uniref:type II secretion system F family protein n=1 Tax=Halorubrum sp. DTA98 TaxID=3402163 RepID=UPI003AAEA3D9
MIVYLPLAAAIGLCLLVFGGSVSARIDLLLTRIALSIFGEYVAEHSPRRESQRTRMRAAYLGETHRVYASRTLLDAGVLGVAGSVIGVYAAAALLAALGVGGEAIAAVLPEPLVFLAGLARLTTIDAPQLFVLLVGSSATVGALLAAGFYYARWELLDQRAMARASEIDATLPRTVAFIYALSRSGTAFPQVLSTLADNEDVYGEAATELSVAVRDMNTFGTDSLTALQRTARRTPSEDLADFSENLASVLGSGQSLSGFLSDQYQRYQEEAEAKQQQYLELLSAFAEAYVTALVAGPLFFITILVVIGLVLQDTLPLLRVVVYLGIPLATFGFIVYVDSVTQGVGGTESVDYDDEPATRERFTLPDGGTVSDRWIDSRERLAAHDRLRTVIEWASSPVETVLRTPHAILVFTGPIALLWVIVSAFPITVGPATRMVAQIDTQIVAATGFVLASYAIVYEIGKHRTRRIERSVPDFLDRLASINEAGTSIVDSVRRVSESDLDALTPELERTWRDVQWGSDVESALRRLEHRVRSPLMSRMVTLVTNAMHASGDLGPVLRIAADEARATQRLQRERKQVMITYLIVIYISFLVFLGIVVALSVSFIPAIEDATISGGTGNVPGGIGGITEGVGEISVFGYEQLFFHAAAIQAVCSGLVAGQLGEGSIRDGVKHAVVLLGLAAVTLTAIGLL